jgi:hypothetical protein
MIRVMASSKQPRRRIIFEVTPSEWADIKARADRAGLTIASMLRRALLLPDEIRRGQRTDLKKTDKPS